MSINVTKRPRGRPKKRGRKPAQVVKYAKQMGRKRKRGRKPAGQIVKPKRWRTQKIEIVARKGQSRPVAEVPVLVETGFGGPVSSSWISRIKWDKDNKEALMLLKNGYFYAVEIPFNIMQRWYYALSKGTFFNERIKGRYNVRRLQ